MVINHKIKDDLKRAIKKARRLTAVRTEEAQKLLRETVKIIDKAVRRGVLKKNTAARNKSRIMTLWNKRTSKES